MVILFFPPKTLIKGFKLLRYKYTYIWKVQSLVNQYSSQKLHHDEKEHTSNYTKRFLKSISQAMNTRKLLSH